MAASLEPVSRTDVRESLRRLRTLVSPYTGLVQTTGEFMRAPDDAGLVKIGVRIADVESLVGFAVEFRSGGSAADLEVALAAALGEAVERYSACYLPESEFVLASAREIGPEAVAPERFALFRDDQYGRPGFPFRPFTSSTRVRWVRGFGIPDGSPAYLPVQLVYLPWRTPQERGEVPISYSTSSGTACGPSLEEAVLSGLLEVVERDAFSLTWYNRLSLPRIDVDADPALARHAARYFDPTGLAYAGIDLSDFLGIPTVLGLVRGAAGDAAALGVGAASAVTLADAWCRALSEAFAVRSWARLMRCEQPDVQYEPDFSDVTSFDDHVLFYSDYENARHTAFLDASPVSREVSAVPPLEGANVRDQIEAIATRLAARGASAYAVDITAADVSDAGLRVVKVVAPELCPLDVAHEGRFLGGSRLYTAAFELGLRDAPIAPDELNPYPHPFP
jgi:ribosomal protein S12 methylthiotransferase accessory factor